MQKPITIILIGAGNRGCTYAEYVAKYRQDAQIVAVAEPRECSRNLIAKQHAIAEQNVCEDWEYLANREKFADAVIIATQDRQHVQPALAFAKQGYHILLEKPIATSLQECRDVANAVLAKEIIFAVCHVLRYTQYTQAIKQLVNSGRIGDVVSIQHLEPVGFWHQAHSYVRGNWRKESESSCMLLAKSCHDIDWLCYIANSRCKYVSSFGNLKHFRKKNKPHLASARCHECSHEPKCPYSAVKIYLKRADAGNFDWPVSTITNDLSLSGVQKALENGPYGRCVYDCDNDVVDHQVVNLLFENGSSASFVMTGFDRMQDRKTTIFGTKGRLYGDGAIIEHYDFLKDSTKTISVNQLDGSIIGGHGGGDHELVKAFIDAVANNNPTKVLSSAQESLESHEIVFAAEQARLKNRVIDISDFRR
ncbi:MAG: oxidoreductase [Planctomycetes bacterium GWF2_42_9]|nr:MAG: oxidoreductase [Planctomycetes bacterium GWF2_42_9]